MAIEFQRNALLGLHARLQNLTVVLHALGLVLLGRGCGLDLNIGVAGAEHVGGHVELLLLEFVVILTS